MRREEMCKACVRKLVILFGLGSKEQARVGPQLYMPSLFTSLLTLYSFPAYLSTLSGDGQIKL